MGSKLPIIACVSLTNPVFGRAVKEASRGRFGCLLCLINEQRMMIMKSRIDDNSMFQHTHWLGLITADVHFCPVRQGGTFL